MNESMLLALPVVELLHEWDSLPVLFEAIAIGAILCALLISIAGFRRTGVAPGSPMTLDGGDRHGACVPERHAIDPPEAAHRHLGLLWRNEPG